MRVVVHIERLVLQGVAHGDRHALAEGLRDALASALSDPTLIDPLRGLGDLPQLQLGRIDVAHGESPRALGEVAAQSIVRGLHEPVKDRREVPQVRGLPGTRRVGE